MADDTSRTLRRTVLPYPDAYKRAQKKFKTWDTAAITEYEKLKSVNARESLTASKHPEKHAVYYHLCELRSRRAYVVVFSIFVFVFR
jgi:hypothetical protein